MGCTEKNWKYSAQFVLSWDLAIWVLVLTRISRNRSVCVYLFTCNIRMFVLKESEIFQLFIIPTFFQFSGWLTGQALSNCGTASKWALNDKQQIKVNSLQANQSETQHGLGRVFSHQLLASFTCYNHELCSQLPCIFLSLQIITKYKLTHVQIGG